MPKPKLKAATFELDECTVVFSAGLINVTFADGKTKTLKNPWCGATKEVKEETMRRELKPRIGDAMEAIARAKGNGRTRLVGPSKKGKQK